MGFRHNHDSKKPDLSARQKFLSLVVLTFTKKTEILSLKITGAE